MSNKKPLILITNDDGYFSKGIAALTNAVKEFGDVVVVAPNGPQSGMSSAITSISPLQFFLHNEEENVKTYICQGTPVDCIKIGMNVVLDRKPDLVVTGVNHGANTAIAVIYSGTMGAAMEASLFDVPAVGFSLLDHDCNADFTESEKVIKTVCEKVLEDGLPSGTCLNVNIPKTDKVKGLRVGRQCKGKWVEEIIPSKDGFDQDVYWLGGYFKSSDETYTGTDEHILKQGYASIVPIKVDMTDYDLLKSLRDWDDTF